MANPLLANWWQDSQLFFGWLTVITGSLMSTLETLTLTVGVTVMFAALEMVSAWLFIPSSKVISGNLSQESFGFKTALATGSFDTVFIGVDFLFFAIQNVRHFLLFVHRHTFVVLYSNTLVPSNLSYLLLIQVAIIHPCYCCWMQTVVRIPAFKSSSVT